MDDWGLVGQGRAVRAFQGAMRAGRLAHAYLLSGPPGVGRRTFAIRMAQALVCVGGAPPCLSCEPCGRLDDSNPMWRLAVRRGHKDEPSEESSGRERRPLDHVLTPYFDLHVLRRAGRRRDISVEGVRAFTSALHLKPAYWPVRIGIIDGAHELNDSAASALLKSLEEPTPHTLMVLIAPRAADMLQTICSRCRVVELGPVSAAEIAAHLAANHGLPEERAEALAAAARGRVGWAVRMAHNTEAWEAEEARRVEAQAFESAGPTERFASVGDILGGGAPLAQAQRAYSWFRALEAVHAHQLRAAMRHNAHDASLADRAALERAVRRMLRLSTAWQNVSRNVTPRLACEDLALRPEDLDPVSA